MSSTARNRIQRDAVRHGYVDFYARCHSIGINYYYSLNEFHKYGNAVDNAFSHRYCVRVDFFWRHIVTYSISYCGAVVNEFFNDDAIFITYSLHDSHSDANAASHAYELDDSVYYTNTNCFAARKRFLRVVYPRRAPWRCVV